MLILNVNKCVFGVFLIFVFLSLSGVSYVEILYFGEVLIY